MDSEVSTYTGWKSWINLRGRWTISELNIFVVQKVDTLSDGYATVYQVLSLETRSWEIPPETLKIKKIIGKGAFGQVAKAVVVNFRGEQGERLVAVKMLKGQWNSSSSFSQQTRNMTYALWTYTLFAILVNFFEDECSADQRRDLMSELEVMRKIPAHTHVVKLLGCVTKIGESAHDRNSENYQYTDESPFSRELIDWIMNGIYSSGKKMKKRKTRKTRDVSRPPSPSSVIAVLVIATVTS